MKEKRIYIFDTTLRDGEQSPGISLNTKSKLEIALQLSRLGVDVIEAGFPATSPGDFEAVKTIAERVKRLIVVGLARAVDEDIDEAWRAICGAERPRIHTFIATSKIHMKKKLNKTGDEVLKMTEQAIRRAKKYTPDVEFSPEDATRSDFDFLCRAIQVALENGATVINIPDTVGYSYPAEFGKLIKNLRICIPELDEVILSVHCHNDLGLAVANSLEAILNGANQVECTINGLGERAGNAALEEIVMFLDTRFVDFQKTTGIRTEEIARTSKLVSSLTNYRVQRNKAIVGANAFAHSSGIHSDGMLKDETTYEIMRPEKIGLKASKLFLDKNSGRNGLKKRLIELGYNIDKEELDRVFVRFKDLADKKSTITDNDLEAIVGEEVRRETEVYQLKYLFTSSSSPNGISIAAVELSKNHEIFTESAIGDGPVDAACKAIDKIVGIDNKLTDFSIEAVTSGKEALGDTNLQIEVGDKSISGRGVSTDIIEASVRAYLNAINQALVLNNKLSKNRKN